MIVTVTPNPSIDRTVTLNGPLTRGAVHRVSSVTSEPGGKGVNVARALTLAGLDAVAVLPAPTTGPLVAALSASAVSFRCVSTAGAVRTNLAITEHDGPGAPAIRHAPCEVLAGRTPAVHQVLLSRDTGAGRATPIGPVGAGPRSCALLRARRLKTIAAFHGDEQFGIFFNAEQRLKNPRFLLRPDAIGHEDRDEWDRARLANHL